MNGLKETLFTFATVETRIKEPVFIITLRLKFNLFNPLNKNPLEAETGRGSYIVGFMSSGFLRTSQSSWHSDQISPVVQKTIRFLNKNSNLSMFSRILDNSSEFLCWKTVLMCARCVLYVRTFLRTLQAGIYNNNHLIKNLFRLPKKNLGSFMRVSTVVGYSIL